MINDRIASNPYEFSYTMRRKLQKKVAKLLIFILFISVITLLFLSFILYPASVKSDSMNPLLEANNQIFISPLMVPKNPLFLGKAVLKRGDIVLISPQSSLRLSGFQKAANILVGFISFRKIYPFTPHKQMSTQPLLRRVVGLPGDTIYVADYTVYIKSKDSQYFLTEFELSKKMYDVAYSFDDAFPAFDASVGSVANLEPFTLQEDEYYVLSDNRISGLDSRIWGPVKEQEIDGKAIIRYFPLHQINLL